jgi:hypothetical protein
MDPQSRGRNGVSGGWSIRSRTDDQGRTLYSIYIGDRMVVSDALSSDGAVIAARKWVQARQDSGRDAIKEGDHAGGANEVGRAQGAAR